MVVGSHPEEETGSAAHEACEVLVFSSSHGFEHAGKRSCHTELGNLIGAQLVEVLHQVGRSFEEAAPS